MRRHDQSPPERLGGMVAAGQLGDPIPIDIEANHGEMPGEIDGERQTDITKADNADSYIG